MRGVKMKKYIELRGKNTDGTNNYIYLLSSKNKGKFNLMNVYTKIAKRGNKGKGA